MNGIFLTGTGTDVGKTIVTAGLLRALRCHKLNAIAAKPFQTGCRCSSGKSDKSDLRSDEFLSGDLQAYLQATDLCGDSLPMDDLMPYRLEPACSPHLAASIKGIECEPDVALHAIQRLTARYEYILVEGSGGVMVPINLQCTMLDFAAQLHLPAIVVVDNRLGCINHALLTIRALMSQGIAVRGIVMNQCSPIQPGKRYLLDDNPLTIARFAGVPVVAEVPHMLDFSSANSACWDIVARSLDNLALQLIMEMI